MATNFESSESLHDDSKLIRPNNRHKSINSTVSDQDRRELSSSQPSQLFGESSSSDVFFDSDSSKLLDADVEELRKKLRKFLDTPRQQWIKRRMISLFALGQTIKTVCVSVLILSFGGVVFDHINFMSNSEEALRHLYFEDWNNLLYTKAYALYSKPDFMHHVDYVLTQFNQTAEQAIGPYEVKKSDGKNRDVPMLHMTYYPSLDLYPSKAQYTFTGSFRTDTLNIHPVEKWDPDTNTTKLEYDLHTFLRGKNKTVIFDNTSQIRLELHLTAIHVGSWTHVGKSAKDAFECYDFIVWITYENNKDNGQLAIDLRIEDHQKSCNNKHTDPSSLLGVPTAACVLVFLLSGASLVCVTRKVFNTWQLKRETKLYFKKSSKELHDRELRIFLNLWDRMIIISDVLLMSGCVTQFCLTVAKVTRIDSTFDYCGMMLGTGCLLSWISLIRDLDIMSTNCNIMILTLQKALYPRIISFLGCVVLLYIGFLLCGWLVLGPHIDKFKTLDVTSETIFSLINGDDVFATFSYLHEVPTRVKVYGQIYLYTYICIFIYVVVNVCISILTDAYEEIRGYYQQGFPKTAIEKFVEETDGPGVREPEPKKGCLYPLIKHCCPIEDELHLDEWRKLGSKAGSLVV